MTTCLIELTTTTTTKTLPLDATNNETLAIWCLWQLGGRSQSPSECRPLDRQHAPLVAEFVHTQRDGGCRLQRVFLRRPRTYCGNGSNGKSGGSGKNA